MKTLIVGTGILVLVSGMGIKAEAVPTLTLSDGTNSVTVADGGAFDTYSGQGVVSYSGNLGPTSPFFINVTTGVSSPPLGSSGAPHLDLNSINITGVQPGVLTITFQDTFVGPLAPYVAGFISTIGGTLAAGGQITYETFVNGQSLGSWDSESGGSFGGSFGTSFLQDAPYYLLSEVITLSLPGGWANASFNAELQALPEPLSLLLVGTGLIGLGFLSRRRRMHKLRG